MGFPRSDLTAALTSGLAVDSYAALKTEPHGTLVVGDLVLLGREIEPVMRSLEASSFEIIVLPATLQQLQAPLQAVPPAAHQPAAPPPSTRALLRCGLLAGAFAARDVGAVPWFGAAAHAFAARAPAAEPDRRRADPPAVIVRAHILRRHYVSAVRARAHGGARAQRGNGMHRSVVRSKPVVGALAAVAAVLAVLIPHAALVGAPLPLRTLADVPLSGGTSRLDYESLDPQAGRLFIAHLGAGSVIAVDTRQRAVLATVPDTPEVRGVLVVPALHRVYAAAAGSAEIVVIDERTLRIVARVPNAGDVDGLTYDPATQRIFVSDEAGGKDDVIDARSNQFVATIDLGGEAGNTQYDPGSGHVFVAVQTRDQLAEIDPRTNRIIGRYDLLGCAHGHGLAIDASARAAYVACEGNAALVTLDLRSHRVIGRASVGDGPDVLAIDPGLRRLYVASESGVVSAFAIGRGRVEKLGAARLAPNAHVVGVDPRTHEVFFPLRNVAGRPVLRIATPTSESAAALP